MFCLPNDKGAAQLLSSALRKPTKLTAIKPPPAADLAIGGLFVDGQDKVVGALLADLPLACYAGAAFSLIPADAARDSVKARELDEFMRENFAEVLNICSSFFNMERTHRVRLSATHYPPNAPGGDMAALAAKPAKRMDVDVEIDGYGKGRMSLLLAA
jgi:hypothetical protein